ncbi:MAG: pilus assembly protein PilA [Legionellales bacterium]|nr:pilus assembly protein PilA [Legionellales bacterium]
METIKNIYNQESGFTLVELMIVIAIIGILMAAGIPSYNRYIKKAHYSEIIQATTPYKIQVEECLQIYNGIEHCNIKKNQVINNKLVNTISISEEGIIKVTPNNEYGITENDTYILTPKITSHGVHWEKSGGGVTNGYA